MGAFNVFNVLFLLKILIEAKYTLINSDNNELEKQMSQTLFEMIENYVQNLNDLENSNELEIDSDENESEISDFALESSSEDEEIIPPKRKVIYISDSQSAIN